MMAHSTCIQTVPQLSITSWQQQLRDAISQPAELLRRLQLPTDLLAGAEAAAALFPLRVPESYLARIEPGNPADPLLRQVLPIGAELTDTFGYSTDPVGDANSMAVPGVLHKYQGRALLVTTGACAVHCRYCFRRHYPYTEASTTPKAMSEAIDYISADASIKEIILSGGDPLSLSDQKLADLIAMLEDIPHIQRLRIHTRQPVVLPSRITPEFIALLKLSRFRLVIVLHINHANEIDADLTSAVKKLSDTGALMLNQAVLLKGVNDSSAAQVALSEALDHIRVQPYYLHTLDKVQGAGHFYIDDQRAKTIIKQAAAQLPGYLVPKLVRETAGKDYKSLLV